ncbi:SDR family NAD(P)-dependent oxidoreductase [Lentzea sp. CA-135723]|uniref:SDR family NAD(P)-dependent oxidoreductase n=1 Tax=Lentzea sp. CA-135723 TaxID=3239950 RepID=UPI003D92873A
MITTEYGFDTTALEVVADVDLTGRRAVVTGGASGIGVETVRALATAGAEVTIAARDQDAAQRVATALTRATGNKAISTAHLDLASPASVKAFARNWDGPLHLLVNNAGVMATPLTRTPEGWELQFATNHYGHFALTTGLFNSLRAEGARVVNVSSSAHLMSDIDFEDTHYTRREYDRWQAYGQSKTANILFGVEAATRWLPEGITMNALMPGSIATNLQRHLTAEQLQAKIRETGAATTRRTKTPEQGAATTLVVATTPHLANVSGKYFEDCNEALPTTPDNQTRGQAPYTQDQESAARLWKQTEETLWTPLHP